MLNFFSLKIELGPAFTDDNDEIQVLSSVGHDDVQFMGVSRLAPSTDVITLT
jgi:hypothetical protein